MRLKVDIGQYAESLSLLLLRILFLFTMLWRWILKETILGSFSTWEHGCPFNEHISYSVYTAPLAALSTFPALLLAPPIQHSLGLTADFLSQAWGIQWLTSLAHQALVRMDPHWLSPEWHLDGHHLERDLSMCIPLWEYVSRRYRGGREERIGIK